jgi:hypothetical protein
MQHQDIKKNENEEEIKNEMELYYNYYDFDI